MPLTTPFGVVIETGAACAAAKVPASATATAICLNLIISLTPFVGLGEPRLATSNRRASFLHVFYVFEYKQEKSVSWVALAVGGRAPLPRVKFTDILVS
ncbi:hypothetical protein [Methyloversatilis discipulorum]|uniref:hypothetical protein n=1 Tax=Methyloversatilis discipulorum TaxID=1119528 RepID=UPI003137A25D